MFDFDWKYFWAPKTFFSGGLWWLHCTARVVKLTNNWWFSVCVPKLPGFHISMNKMRWWFNKVSFDSFGTTNILRKCKTIRRWFAFFPQINFFPFTFNGKFFAENIQFHIDKLTCAFLNILLSFSTMMLCYFWRNLPNIRLCVSRKSFKIQSKMWLLQV